MNKQTANNLAALKPLPPSQQEVIDRLKKELKEMMLMQDVLVAAGIVDREKIDQAYEIVRKFP